MATNTKNVLVGAASIFVSVGNSSNDAGRPTTKTADITSLFGANNTVSARSALLGNTSLYREVGYTSSGFEVSYEPNYGEVAVDQLLDAARLFKQSLKVMLKTELTEGTLENLQLSWGQLDYVYGTNSTGTALQAISTLIPNDSTIYSSSDSPAATLKLAAGALGDAPVERVLIAVGQAPAQIGSSVTTTDAGTSNPAGSNTSVARQKERVYVARRVVSIDTTAHSLKRDAATVFPVSFRCLPDSDPAYSGMEYGVVIDRVYGSI